MVTAARPEDEEEEDVRRRARRSSVTLDPRPQYAPPSRTAATKIPSAAARGLALADAKEPPVLQSQLSATSVGSSRAGDLKSVGHATRGSLLSAQTDAAWLEDQADEFRAQLEAAESLAEERLEQIMEAAHAGQRLVEENHELQLQVEALKQQLEGKPQPSARRCGGDDHAYVQLEAKYEEAETQVHELKAELQRAAVRTKEAELEHSVTCTRLRKVQQEANDQVQELLRLSAALEESQQSLRAHQQANHQLRQEIETLRAVRQKHVDCTPLLDTIQAAELTPRQALEETPEAVLTELARKTRLVHELQQQLALLRKKFCGLRWLYIAGVHVRDSMQQDLQTAQEEQDKAQSKVRDAERSVRQQRAKTAALESRAAELEMEKLEQLRKEALEGEQRARRESAAELTRRDSEASSVVPLELGRDEALRGSLQDLLQANDLLPPQPTLQEQTETARRLGTLKAQAVEEARQLARDAEARPPDAQSEVSVSVADQVEQLEVVLEQVLQNPQSRDSAAVRRRLRKALIRARAQSGESDSEIQHLHCMLRKLDAHIKACTAGARRLEEHSEAVPVAVSMDEAAKRRRETLKAKAKEAASTVGRLHAATNNLKSLGHSSSGGDPKLRKSVVDKNVRIGDRKDEESTSSWWSWGGPAKSKESGVANAWEHLKAGFMHGAEEADASEPEAKAASEWKALRGALRTDAPSLPAFGSKARRDRVRRVEG